VSPTPKSSRVLLIAAIIAVVLICLCIYLFRHHPWYSTRTSTMGEAIPIALNGGSNVTYTAGTPFNCPVTIQGSTKANAYAYVIMSLDATGQSICSPPAGCVKYGATPWPCELTQQAMGTTADVTFMLTVRGTAKKFAIQTWEVAHYQSNLNTPDHSVQAIPK